jgi:hypothetical protein
MRTVMLPSTVALCIGVTTPSIIWYTMAPALICELVKVTVIGFWLPFPSNSVSGTVAVAPLPSIQETMTEKK